MELICWILIGILAFYFVRNIIAGSLYYPIGWYLLDKWNKGMPKYLQKRNIFRNYYLYVLNPFWWGIFSIVKDGVLRETFKQIWRDREIIQANLQRLK